MLVGVFFLPQGGSPAGFIATFRRGTVSEQPSRIDARRLGED
jgi:hypothetical protein